MRLDISVRVLENHNKSCNSMLAILKKSAEYSVLRFHVGVLSDVSFINTKGNCFAD